MSIPEHLQKSADAFLQQDSVSKLGDLADEEIRSSFEDLLHHVAADAGAVWIVGKDNEELTIAVNVGARGSSIEGSVSQGLDSGLVSKAFKEETMVRDEGAFRHREQSLAVDMKLGQLTAYQIACPFSMFGKTIGAVTVVQLSTPQNAGKREWGFDEEAANSVTRWVSIAQRLFEYEALKNS